MRIEEVSASYKPQNQDTARQPHYHPPQMQILNSETGEFEDVLGKPCPNMIYVPIGGRCAVIAKNVIDIGRNWGEA